MAITNKQKEELLVKIEDQPGESTGERLANGLIKTSKGLVIPPGGFRRSTGVNTAKVEAELEHLREQQVQPKRKAVKGRKSTYVEEQPVAPKPEVKLVHIQVEGFGEIPSQYTHVYKGAGVLVLGMNNFSYTPPKAQKTTQGVTGVLSLTDDPYTRYVYTGFEFRDNTGERNIVLLQLPQEKQQEQPTKQSQPVKQSNTEELEEEFEEMLDDND